MTDSTDSKTEVQTSLKNNKKDGQDNVLGCDVVSWYLESSISM